MDATLQISKFETFFEEYYHAEVLEAIRKGQGYLEVDFKLLTKFDSDFATYLLDSPRETMQAAELAIAKFDPDKTIVKYFHIRFLHLPLEQEIKISEIRAKYIHKFLRIQCVIRRQSRVMPQASSTSYECPSCGNVIHVTQIEEELKTPIKCGCGRKGKFRFLDHKFINVQTIVGSEIPEDIAGDQQPEQIPMMLDDDLTKKFNRKNTQPGKKLIVSGVLLEKKIKLKSGETSTTFDYVFDVNSIESLDESELDIDVSKEDIIAIKEFAKQPDAMNKLINMIAPSIYGCKPQKETILHILAGGIRRVKPDGSIKRGDMHGLLAGEPGLAKSDLLLRAKIIAHKARYVSGKGTSGVGITASVIKDDILGGWALEAGAMVLANKGFVMIDELDKMGAEDRSYLHEALEQQTITISKANIQATLRCETTAIAACNPKNNLFNDHELNFSKQLDIPSSLLNRFDIILKIRDIVDSKKDGKLVKHIFNSFREISEKDLDKRLNQLRTKEDIFLKKFLSYVRTLIPIWTKEAEELIEAWYVHARDKREPDSLPINPRQVHAVVRLAESDAKIRIDEKITIAHVKEAIRLMEYSLIQIGCLNSDTGRFSMDSILGSDCDLRIIGNIIMKMDAPSMSLDYIIDEAKAKGITEDTTLKKIEKLKRSGNIFEPKPGQIMKV